MKKAVAGLLLAGTVLRLAALGGAGGLVKEWAGRITSDGSLVSATLRLELGGAGEQGAPEREETPAMPESAELSARVPAAAPEFIEVQKPVSEPEETPEEKNDGPEIKPAHLSSDVKIKNDTGFEVDAEALSSEGLSLRLSETEPSILIVHTHGSEAYTMDGDDIYVESDESRTEDKNYNVIRLGDELTERLEECGLKVLHDREIYDYPSYTGSYNRSGASVENYLAEYPSIKIVIDLHRDAIGSGDTIYKTQAEVDGETSAQVMLLVGTGENGLAHPNWRENLKLALYMQNAMDAKYPTLSRPIALKKERYNQQLTTGSLIMEVGSSGNTLQEALTAIRLFADSAGPKLAELMGE